MESEEAATLGGGGRIHGVAQGVLCLQTPALSSREGAVCQVDLNREGVKKIRWWPS